MAGCHFPCEQNGVGVWNCTIQSFYMVTLYKGVSCHYRKKNCCGRMNPVFNRMCSFKEMFSADYFKTFLFSYIPCLFLLGIQDQLLWLCSQSHHCWCKSPLLRRKCHLKGPSCALLPDQLFICLQISGQNFSSSPFAF